MFNDGNEMDRERERYTRQTIEICNEIICAQTMQLKLNSFVSQGSEKNPLRAKSIHNACELKQQQSRQ